MPPPSRPRAMLINVALLVASVVLALAVAEGIARVRGRPSPPPPTPLDPELAGLPKLHGIMELAQPNVRGVFKRVPYRSNSQGVRGPERTIPKAARIFRIVIIGDSFTMGSGVREEDTYPARLEAMLNARADTRTYEVVNLGIGGLNLAMSLARLERIGLTYEPDLVIYGWTINDIEGPSYRRSHEQEHWAPGQSSRSYLVRWAYPRWLSLRDTFAPAPGSYAYELEDNYFRNPEAWSAFTSDLDRLAAIVGREQVCGVVLVHTLMYALDWPHPFARHYEATAAAARERGLAAILSLPAFLGRHAPALWISPLDWHPNAEGHALLADVLVRGLDELPLACGLTADAGDTAAR